MHLGFPCLLILAPIAAFIILLGPLAPIEAALGAIALASYLIATRETVRLARATIARRADR